MKVEKVSITPAMAEKMLEKNTHNRSLDDARVRGYAGTMRQGEWLPYASMISIAPDGSIIDGQHRLWAIVESGLAQEFVLAIEAAVETQDVIDTGRKRTVADQLHLGGERDAAALAAIIKVAARWDLGARGAAIFSTNEMAGKGKGWPDTRAARHYLEEHPYIRDVREYVRPAARKLRAGAGALGLVGVQAHRLAPDEAQQFFTSLESGAGLQQTSAIHVLRERLIAAAADRRAKRPPELIAAEVTKAWNLWRSDTPATPARLRWRMEGDAEAFPVAA